jgi:hypothetical protein
MVKYPHDIDEMNSHKRLTTVRDRREKIELYSPIFSRQHDVARTRAGCELILSSAFPLFHEIKLINQLRFRGKNCALLWTRKKNGKMRIDCRV